MIDKTLGCCNRPSNEPLCCISVNKIFDSARDKDCLEDVRVYLGPEAQEIIDHSSNIRSKNIEVVWTNINVEPIPFNKGYFQVLIRFYFCVTFEVCVANGRAVEIQGLVVCDKKIILFGSEKNVSIFTSDPEQNNFCPEFTDFDCHSQSTLPTVVVEIASPIVLDTKIVERCRPFGNCCCGIDAIPDNVRNRFGCNFIDNMGVNQLYVSIGMFTVIRMERPVQLMIPASTFCLPDKDSVPAVSSSDPCKIFSKMNFPMNEFFPYVEEPSNNLNKSGCCNK